VHRQGQALLQGCPQVGGSDLVTIREAAVTNHKFKIGQSVNYTSGTFGVGRGGGVYKVTQLLPPEGDEFQYKIKSAAEPHERVAKESQLDRAG
jgi:hypothetical protein